MTNGWRLCGAKLYGAKALGHINQYGLLVVLIMAGLLINSATSNSAVADGYVSPYGANNAGQTSRWNNQWNSRYDNFFKQYSKRFFGPAFDWRWFKAQAVAESALKPKATSNKGARGLMQIMPRTYKDILRKNPHFKEVNAERWNIAAGIYYNRFLFRIWAGLPTDERLKFMLASYNAGPTAIANARRRAGGAEVQHWADVAPHAPRETRNYVAYILKLYAKLQPNY